MNDRVSPTSARILCAQIANGDLTAQATLDGAEERIAAFEPEIRAFTHPAPVLRPRGGPLSGISVGVKDIFDTRDMPATYGSPIYEDHQPVADASLVAMLQQAGATIGGKTVTTEFAWFQPGPTRNPHNPDHTPGGSSSGSAAGVAAGFFPAAIGTQTGGSIVRPAAFCGVAGYKPSFRLFPTIGMKHFSWSLDTIGFFAATIADVGFISAICSGRDLDIAEQDHGAPRIGLVQSAIDDLVVPDMADALNAAAQASEAAGAKVTTITLPDAIEKARHAHAPIQDFEARMALIDERLNHPSHLSPKLAAHLEDAAKLTPDDYDNARRTANHGRKACHALFDDVDVLLAPSAPGAAPYSLETTGDSVFNRLWTLLGLPCVNVPGPKDETGLPLGLQVIGRFGRDRKTLAAAHWLEGVLAKVS